MQSLKGSVAAAALLVSVARADDASSNPLSTVLGLMDELAAKIKADGAAEEKAYKEYFEWCDDVSTDKNQQITTATAQKEKLTATISELKAEIEAADTKINELSSSISSGEKELAEATSIREKEAAEFAASEKELAEAVDTMARAMQILEKEMAKSPGSFAQISTADTSKVMEALQVVVDAAGFAASDRNRLVALVQARQGSDEEDSETGAPAAAVYESKSGSIIDVIADMQSKAEEELAELRKSERTAQHNFNMLKQSLEDQLAVDNKDMDATKNKKAADSEAQATAQGELDVTTKDLKATTESLASSNANCMTVAADHEASLKSRAEELKVVAEARKIVADSAGGAGEQTYSLLQVSAQSRATLARNEIVAMIKKLARQQHSSALAQLASRVTAVVRYGAKGSADPFVKIRGLIEDMIAKLENEAKEEATEKAYCDEEMSKTTASKKELDTEIAKLTTKIDQDAASSTELKAEVKDLQSELATMEKEQSEAEKVRSDEHAEYLVVKEDLEKGIAGVRKALDLLTEYYAAGSSFVQQPAPPQGHSKSEGAGGSIINILQVCESDFAENLAKVETEESDAQSAFDTNTQEYKVTKTEKDADVKYKTQEFTALDKNIADLSGDRDTANTEVSAVNEYLEKLKDRCVAKPETYEDRKKRRDAEVAGLKEALNVLENETALLQQRKGKKRSMRGAALAAH